jgi:hypothetical protein
MEFMKEDFVPYFVVQEDHKIETMQKVPISEQSISDMMRRGVFRVDRIQITVSKQFASTTISLCLREAAYPLSADSYLPISGFPRKLMTEDIPRRKQTFFLFFSATSHQTFYAPLTWYSRAPSESSIRNPAVRNSGSFTRRTHRRRRQMTGAGGSGSDSLNSETSSPLPLRRVKSQSNAKSNPGTGPSTETSVPESPNDVKAWAARRKSMEIVTTPRPRVFELADTSTLGIMDAGGSSNSGVTFYDMMNEGERGSTRRKSLFGMQW